MDTNAAPIKEYAIEALRAICTNLDPLYRPAEFLLAYSYLSRGDGQNAAVGFRRLVERFEDESAQVIEKLSKEWLGVRWIKLGRQISFVNQWIEYYADSMSYLHGGQYVIAAKTWKNLRAALAEPSAPVYRSVREQLIEMQIDTLSRSLGSRDLPDIVAGKVKSVTTPPEKARAMLDYLLDENEIYDFDLTLMLLDTDYAFQELAQGFQNAGIPSPSVPEDDSATDLSKLSKHRIVSLLESTVNQLKSHVDQRDWAAAREIIRRMRRYTRDRSPNEFAAVLDNTEMETWKVWVAGLFVPAFNNVRRRRNELRQPLYTESMYYLARSLLMSFEPEGLKNAHEVAETLRQKRLAPNVPGRQRNLHILTVCLEVEALERWTAMEPNHDAEGALDSLVSKWGDKLEKTTSTKSLSGEVLGAAWVALGMIERRSRRRMFDSSDDQKRANSLYREMNCYRKALELKPTATTYCYIAECLLERKRPDDAGLHVQQALIMAPAHILAKRLSEAHSGQS